MKMKSLAAAIALTIVPASGVFAAALDRSGQSIAAFLQPGNYAEVGGSYLDPDVSGKDRSGNSIGNMADTYHFWNAAIKLQPSDYFSFGLIYDQPFGADATYKGNNNFTAQPNGKYAESIFGPQALNNAALGISGSTHVEVESRNITSLFGIKPIDNFTLYGGLVYQEVEGNLNLRGAAYGPISGYDAEMSKDSAFGWIAGAAYEIPEIALKASVTYRSEIDHKAKTNENLALGTAARGIIAGINSQLPSNLVGSNTTQTIANINGALTQINAGLTQINAGLTQINAALAANPGNATLIAQQAALTVQQTALTTQQNGLTAAQGGLNSLAAPSALPANAQTTTKITTPQSVNLDFQTGIMANTVAFANVRWVEWSGFSIQPPLFGTTTSGLDLVNYSKDQWSANVGVGRKLTDQWAGNLSAGWDSGAGNPVTTLGPTEGYWNVGLGVQYSPAANYFVAGGVKYFWLGDADAKISSGTIVGNFNDNHAIAAGLKLGYRF